MIAEIIKILTVIGFSATKYMMGVGLVFTYAYNFFEAMLLTLGGGMLGVFLFSKFSNLLLKYFLPQNPDDPPKTRMGWSRRTLVKFRSKYGLVGIAFLTPIFLTVPIGTFLANSMTKDKRDVITYMFIAFAFWSVIFNGAFYFLGIDVQKYLEKLVIWM